MGCPNGPTANFLQNLKLKNLWAVKFTAYDGNSGAEQRTFNRDAQIGWRDIRRESQEHLIEGVSQYEYQERVGSKLTGEAKKVLNSFLNKWQWTNRKNPNLEKATEREGAHALWRKFYHKTGAWTMKMIHSSTTAPRLVRPDQMEG